MEEIKLTGNNRLPKYWAVQCPEEDDDDYPLFLNTVIRYICEVIGEHWNGNSCGDYYGYDGDKEFKGTNVYSDMKSFINNPTLLTLQEFIECFKEDSTKLNELPEEYIVECKNADETNEVNRYFYKVPERIKLNHWKYLICSNTLCLSDGQPNGATIENRIQEEYSHFPVFTFEEWKSMVDGFVLPEKWFVKVTSVNDYKEHALSKGYDITHYWIQEYEGKEYYYYSEIYWGHQGFVGRAYFPEEFTEITLEQFNKYVLKNNNNKNTQSGKLNNLNKNNMDSFTVSGSATLKEAFAKELGVEFFDSKTLDFQYIGSEEEGTLQGYIYKEEVHFDLPKEWDNAVEYGKQYYSAKVTEVYFGDLLLKITKGDDYAETCYGRIYKSNIEDVLSMFNNTGIEICGYSLQINGGDVDNIKINFGCKIDTVGKAKEILSIFNNN